MRICERIGCENLVPEGNRYVKRFCSRSCASKISATNQWKRDSHRESVKLSLDKRVKKHEEEISRVMKSLEGMDPYSIPYLKTLVACKSHDRSNRSYGLLTKQFPKHWNAFDSICQRIPLIGGDYEYTPNSFIKFILDIGPVPADMIYSTVGRIDHSK